MCFPVLGPNWPWYIDIGTTEFRADLDAWVFKDLFVDIIVQHDNISHSVLDLDDLAEVHSLGLVGGKEVEDILRSTQVLLDIIRSAEFPPEEIRNPEAFRAELGW